jgi:hypothetical protein
MEALFNKFHWRSKNKWLDAADRPGFDRTEALKHFKNVDHDFKIERNDKLFLPIFSRKRDCYQFDTLVQADAHPWLIFINTNSRKGFAYPMAQ